MSWLLKLYPPAWQRRFRREETRTIRTLCAGSLVNLNELLQMTADVLGVT